MAHLGVVPIIGFLDALYVMNAVITEKMHQMTIKRCHTNFKHKKIGMIHMPSNVAI